MPDRTDWLTLEDAEREHCELAREPEQREAGLDKLNIEFDVSPHRRPGIRPRAELSGSPADRLERILGRRRCQAAGTGDCRVVDMSREDLMTVTSAVTVVEQAEVL